MRTLVRHNLPSSVGVNERAIFLARRYGSDPTQERRKPRAWYVDRQTQVATIAAILLDLALVALGLWWLIRLCIRIGHSL